MSAILISVSGTEKLKKWEIDEKFDRDRKEPLKQKPHQSKKSHQDRSRKPYHEKSLTVIKKSA